MARKVKCAHCGKHGRSGEFHGVPKDDSRKRFTYYCSEDEYNLHEKEQEEKRVAKEVLFIEKELKRLEKEKETKKYKDLIEFIMSEIYHYEEGMIFPSSLIKRIKKLREFYDYDIIKEAFTVSYDSIMWAMSNREFTNEYNKTSYIMAIVENKINDVYLEVKRKKEQDKKAVQLEDKVDLSLFNDFADVNNAPSKSKSKDISAFLDD